MCKKLCSLSTFGPVPTYIFIFFYITSFGKEIAYLAPIDLAKIHGTHHLFQEITAITVTAAEAKPVEVVSNRGWWKRTSVEEHRGV